MQPLELLESPRTAMGVGVATAGTGLGVIFDKLTVAFGLIAIVAGVILTIVITYIQIKQHIQKTKLSKLESQKLKLEIEELKKGK